MESWDIERLSSEGWRKKIHRPRREALWDPRLVDEHLDPWGIQRDREDHRHNKSKTKWPDLVFSGHGPHLREILPDDSLIWIKAMIQDQTHSTGREAVQI
jgi:hypothetical protein